MFDKLLSKLKIVRVNVICYRYLSHNSSKSELKENINRERVQAWQIHSYGNIKNVIKLSNIKLPVISKPTDVLIKVEATSINPIDVAMINGYGSKVLNIIRKVNEFSFDIEFPLTVGRDFTGVIVSKGHQVDETLKLGDKVWGVVPFDRNGCHAHYLVTNHNLVAPKPNNLSEIEASSILYAGLTAWSALWYTGGLSYKTLSAISSNKQILVLGGSGGVGTLAIQIAKAWNLRVVTTCQNDAAYLLEKLGADVTINYKNSDVDSIINKEGPYDIILDCCKQGLEKVKSKGYSYNTYITLNSPFLKNIDKFGFLFGSAKNFNDLINSNVPTTKNEGCTKWGFFIPSKSGIKVLQKLAEQQKLVPVIDSVYSFDQVPEAYEKVSKGHLRGKVVIDINK